jgi:hypothetical protein
MRPTVDLWTPAALANSAWLRSARLLAALINPDTGYPRSSSWYATRLGMAPTFPRRSTAPQPSAAGSCGQPRPVDNLSHPSTTLHVLHFSIDFALHPETQPLRCSSAGFAHPKLPTSHQFDSPATWPTASDLASHGPRIDDLSLLLCTQRCNPMIVRYRHLVASKCLGATTCRCRRRMTVARGTARHRSLPAQGAWGQPLPG